MRFPVWLLSTSTLSECMSALITTVFVVEGLTEIDPYGLLTEIPALAPTLKRYSLRLCATSVPVNIAPTTASSIVRLLIDSPSFLSHVACGTKAVRTLWQRTVHGHLKKHGFLLIRFHQ